MNGSVLSVGRSATHSFSKPPAEEISIVAGLGVEGDAHAGETVRHRYRVRKDPGAPNLTQVHLLQAELFPELAEAGLVVTFGEMGENVTTHGIDLLGLPRHTRLQLGPTAIVEVTGLRTPCVQMDRFQPGLQRACVAKNRAGKPLPRAGIMGIALSAGTVRPGDAIRIFLPEEPWSALGLV